MRICSRSSAAFRNPSPSGVRAVCQLMQLRSPVVSEFSSPRFCKNTSAVCFDYPRRLSCSEMLGVRITGWTSELACIGVIPPCAQGAEDVTLPRTRHTLQVAPQRFSSARDWVTKPLPICVGHINSSIASMVTVIVCLIESNGCNKMILQSLRKRGRHQFYVGPHSCEATIAE